MIEESEDIDGLLCDCQATLGLMLLYISGEHEVTKAEMTQSCDDMFSRVTTHLNNRQGHVVVRVDDVFAMVLAIENALQYITGSHYPKHDKECVVDDLDGAFNIANNLLVST